MVVEEQGTEFCDGGRRGSGWVVRVGGCGNFWWVLQWFSWWVVGFMVVVVWVVGDWVYALGLWWLWYE